MQKKYLLSLSILGLLLFVSLALGASYCFYNLSHHEDKLAYTETGCIEIIYSDSKNFNLINPGSYSDDDGVRTSPKTMAITNNCSEDKKLELRLDETNDSSLSPKNIKVYVNGEYDLQPTLLNNIKNITGTNNIKNTYRLLKFTIPSSTTKRLNFRMWLDEDAVTTDDRNSFYTKYYISDGELITKLAAEDTIINNNGGEDSIIAKGTPDYSNPATTDEGLYKTAGYYYFRGASTNNYLNLANITWRIVGITNTGSIKLAYVTNTLNTIYNAAYQDESDVGYTTNVPTTTNSTIKDYLENWYNANIANNPDAKYLTADEFVNDTTTSTSSYRQNFGAYTRLFNNYEPSISSVENDKSYGGNYKTNIGTLSLDECVLAGASYGQSNNSFFLYTGSTYFTLSPAYYNGQANVAVINQLGRIDALPVNYERTTIPVVYLSNTANLKGTGTINDPYLLDLEE